MMNGVVEIVGVVQQEGWWASFTIVVVLLMLFVVISTFPPSSGVPTAGTTACRMWVVHGRAGVDVVSGWLEERRESQGVCHLLQTASPRVERFHGSATQEAKTLRRESTRGRTHATLRTERSDWGVKRGGKKNG